MSSPIVAAVMKTEEWLQLVTFSARQNPSSRKNPSINSQRVVLYSLVISFGANWAWFCFAGVLFFSPGISNSRPIPFHQPEKNASREGRGDRGSPPKSFGISGDGDAKGILPREDRPHRSSVKTAVL